MTKSEITYTKLHGELAERLAETQATLSFSRLLPGQRTAAPSIILRFPGKEA
ncbi:MAG: hypothetical protein AAGA38_08590 [Pseudomonadota bacterium]